jgi:hypothetical protein
MKLRVFFTRRRIGVRISKPQAFKGQLLPSAERVNPPKNKFFGTMTRLKVGLAEFDHTLHQCLKVSRHLWRFPLIIDQWRK